MRAREDAAGQAFAFPNQSEKEMLGLNRNAAELAGLIAREEKNSSGSLGIPFEHPACLGESRQCCGHTKPDHIIRHPDPYRRRAAAAVAIRSHSDEAPVLEPEHP